MVALRAENYTLTEIADILGLVNHTSVLHHLNGKCGCNPERSEPCLK
ncbi:hypothetical protein LCGC14_1511810, partial [marine sediment metagenome]